MAQGRDFTVLFPLYDVTIWALPPNTTGAVTPVSGTSGSSGSATYITITPYTIPNGSGALPSGVVAEILVAEVTPPVVSNSGSLVYPDFQWNYYLDSTSIRNPIPGAQLFFDGSYGGNMMPPREKTVGRKQNEMGISIRRLLTEAKNGHPRNNMALLATGLKYVQSAQTQVYSQRGWGPGVPGDTVVTPARIRFWGERYTQALLDLLAAFWNGAFSRTSLRRLVEVGQVPTTISGRNTGTVSVATWTSLPGGYNQKGAEIWPYWSFAYPAVATPTSTPFYLTQNTQVGGVPGNVANQYSGDLGYQFAPVQGSQAQLNTAIFFNRFGVTAGNPNIAFAGFTIGGANVPDPNGWPVGYETDRWTYGQAQPIRDSSGLWFAVPELEGEIDVYGENAAVFITGNGNAVAANSVAVAVGGVAVQLPAA